MSRDSGRIADQSYQWTPARLLLAVVIVAIAGAAMAVVANVTLGDRGFPERASRPLGAARPAATRPTVDSSFDFDNLVISRADILHGGPGKDGIPALRNPATVSVADADFLEPDDRVIGLTINDQSRAYPLAILIQHEAANDELGDTPILVVYCPLCDSVSVVDRRLDGETHEFGVSGLLYNSNVLLYDRNDDSLWSQLGFSAISGPNAGKSLQHLGWELTTFADWSKRHPESTVLSFDTGHQRNYRRNLYGDYLESDRLIFPVANSDTRLKRKDQIIAVKLGEAVKAYPISEIQRAPDGVVRDTIEGQSIVLIADAQTGAVRVVEAPANAFIAHTFWFAWVAFEPGTEIYRAN